MRKLAENNSVVAAALSGADQQSQSASGEGEDEGELSQEEKKLKSYTKFVLGLFCSLGKKRRRARDAGDWPFGIQFPRLRMVAIGDVPVRIADKNPNSMFRARNRNGWTGGEERNMNLKIRMPKNSIKAAKTGLSE